MRTRSKNSIRVSEFRREHTNDYMEEQRRNQFPQGIENVVPPWLLFGRLSIAAFAYTKQYGNEEEIAQAYSIPSL